MDWDNVKLVLSTGDPNTNNIMPELDPKYLNFVNANYRRTNGVSRSNFKYNPTVRNVSGIVTDDSGLPLPGVNVIEVGSNNGTTTDFDGRYQLSIKGGRELNFSYIGFISEIIPINLVFEERMPISQYKETKVEEIETGGGDYDEKRAWLNGD